MIEVDGVWQMPLCTKERHTRADDAYEPKMRRHLAALIVESAIRALVIGVAATLWAGGSVGDAAVLVALGIAASQCVPAKPSWGAELQKVSK